MSKGARDSGPASTGTAADEAKRLAKLQELRRRQAETPSGMPTGAAPAPVREGSDDGKRGKLRELLNRRGGGGGAAGGGGQGGPLGRGGGGGGAGGSGAGRQLGRGGGLGFGKAGESEGGGDGAGGGRGEFLRRALEKRRGGDAEQGGGKGTGGALLRHLIERGGIGEGRRGGSDREAELEERVRRLEEQLASLREIATKKGD